MKDIKQKDFYNIRTDTAKDILNVIGNMEIINRDGSVSKIKDSDIGWYESICRDYDVSCTEKNIDNRYYERKPNRKRPIYQIDKDTGEIVYEYESIQEAHYMTGIPTGNISKACTHKNWTAYGYKWRFVEDTKYPPIRSGCKGKPVKQIDSTTGEIKHVFISLREAGRHMGVNDSTIYKACKGTLKTAKGYYWRYVEDDK